MKPNTKILLAASTLLLASVFTPWADAADLLTLGQAIQFAVAGNPVLRNAEMDIAKARAQAAGQHTRLYPSFQINASAHQLLTPFDFTLQRGLLGVYPGIGPIPASDTPIRTPLRPTGIFSGDITLPLLTQYRVRQNLKVLDFSTRIAEEQMRATKQQVVHDVKSLYYSIQQAQSALLAADETLKLYREVESLTQRYVAEQTALKGDLLQAQTQLARGEQNRSGISDQLDSAKEMLNRLLGRDILAAFDVTDPQQASDLEGNIEAARSRAMEQRPELFQARLKLLQAEQDRRAKKAEYIPDLNATVTAVDAVGFNSFIPLHFVSAGFSASWEPFDWGRKKQELAQKDAVIQQARNTSSDTENQILIEVNEKFRALRQSRSQLTVTLLAQETAAENLRVMRQRFEQQASLARDVLQAESALEQANSDYQQALAAFGKARADFEKATGEDQ
jgi:outer membrane protein TolC